MEKKSGSIRNLIISFVVFTVAVTVAATSIYGWFVMSAKPATGGIINEVTEGLEVSLKIDGVSYTGSSLTLDNALPGSEYLFEFTAVSQNTIAVNIVLQFSESVFEISEGVYGDIRDAFAIKYPFDASTYTRLSQLDGGTAVSGAVLQGGQSTVVKFTLLFPTDPPEGVDINIYQERSLTISRMLFLGVN